jgi:hypothetical protein
MYISFFKHMVYFLSFECKLICEYDEIEFF